MVFRKIIPSNAKDSFDCSVVCLAAQIFGEIYPGIFLDLLQTELLYVNICQQPEAIRGTSMWLWLLLLTPNITVTLDVPLRSALAPNLNSSLTSDLLIHSAHGGPFWLRGKDNQRPVNRTTEGHRDDSSSQSHIFFIPMSERSWFITPTHQTFRGQTDIFVCRRL